MKARVHQIFYDGASRAALDAGFVALDNTANARPDWYEFAVMRDFLRHQRLDDDTWYGFLSPRFAGKTGLGAADVHAFLEQVDRSADVALFSSDWDQVAYFLNAFEQGELWHPGLGAVAQDFLDRAGVDFDVHGHPGHALDTVFCNYIVARPVFWRDWLDLANALFDEAEDDMADVGAVLRGVTAYGTGGAEAPMKVFLQERLACALLGARDYRTATPDLSTHSPPSPVLFADSGSTRAALLACERAKRAFASGTGIGALDDYERARASIATRFRPADPSRFRARRGPAGP